MHLSYFLDTTIVTLLFSVRHFKMYAKTIVLQKQGIPNCYVAYFGDLHSRVTIMISNSFFRYNIILFKPTTFYRAIQMLHTAMEMKPDNQCCKYLYIIYIQIYMYMSIYHMYIVDVVYTI